MATCMYCNYEMCFQCENPREHEDSSDSYGELYRCCCDGMGYRPTGQLTLAETFMANRNDDAEPDELPSREKSGDQMKDVLSTGRKRAAKAAPITPGMACEWQGLLFAGGGVHPVIGCVSGVASDIHHGPDKSVLNNVVGTNLHRVCDHCHNRWHALNDPYYGVRPENGDPFLPLPGNPRHMHDPFTKATPSDQIANEAWWTKRPEDRTEYRDWSLTTVEHSDTIFVEPNGEAA